MGFNPLKRNTPVDTRTYSFAIPTTGGEFAPPAQNRITQEILPEGITDRLVTVSVGLFDASGQYFRIPPGLTQPIPYAIVSFEDTKIGAIPQRTGNGGPGFGTRQAQVVVPDIPFYTAVPFDRRLYANVRGPLPAVAAPLAAPAQLFISVSSYPAELGGDTAGVKRVLEEKNDELHRLLRGLLDTAKRQRG